MSNNRLLETLEPPPGGTARLRVRIKADQRRRARNGILLITAATVLLVTLAVSIFQPAGREIDMLPGLESDLLAIQLGLVDPPTETVSIRSDLRHQYAVRRVPTANEKVVLYLVGSRQSP